MPTSCGLRAVTYDQVDHDAFLNMQSPASTLDHANILSPGRVSISLSRQLFFSHSPADLGYLQRSP